MITPTPFTPSPETAGGLRLWLVDTGRHAAWASALADSVLDQEELARAARFHRAEDRRDYVVSHVALRTLLAARTGLRANALPLTRAACPGCGGPHGRPELADSAAEFSLSHASGQTLVAVADTVVGVDIEAVPAPAAVADLTSALHQDEQRELAALAEAERPAAFTRVWARKESYLKALGTGLGRDPAADYVGSGVSAAAPAPWRIDDVLVPGDFRAAVAHLPRGQ